MREIIEKLYYGNIKPTEKPIKEESGYQESARLAVRHEEYLLKSLIGEQKATFEKFTDAMSEVDCYEREEAFVSGFRIGAQLMLAALSDGKSNLRPFS